jgi:hypothetical protein
MARPPSNVEPSELFQKLLERPAPNEQFPYPRLGDDGEPVFNVRIFVLPDKDLVAAKLSARKWLAAKAGEQHESIREYDEQLIGDRVCKELLFRSVREDKDIQGTGHYKYIFGSADDVEKLPSDEIACLYGAYLVLQQMYGPTDASFSSDAEVNEWIERLKKGGGRFLLPLLQSHQRDELLMSLVDREWSLRQALTSLQESLPESLESIRETSLAGIDSSTQPVADSTPSQEPDVVSKEMAVASAEGKMLTTEAARAAAAMVRKTSLGK